jgi:histidine ammonia-lyase
MRVLGIELLAACQAIDLQAGGELSPASSLAYDCLRRVVPTLKEDRVLYPDLNAAYALLQSGELQAEVERFTGELVRLSSEQ